MTTVSFQQGVNGYAGTIDTMLQQSTPTTTYDTSTKVGTDAGTNANVQTLLTFNDIFGTGPGQIPLGATITSATLTLQTTNGSVQGASLHRMLINWIGVPIKTWDAFNNGIQVDGTEALGVADVSTGAIDVGSRDLDVTMSLQAWSNGEANFGWAFMGGGKDGWDFYSAQGKITPKLTVTYTTDPSTPPAAGINIVQSNGSTQVTEGGNTDTFTIALSSAPTANVVITINNTADVTGSPSTLTFTPANWNTPQTVTVTAIDDTQFEGPETSNLTFSVSSADTRYNNFSIAPVAVTVIDNDPPPAAPPVISIDSATAAENAGVMTFTVHLDKSASQPVTVTYATANDTALAGSDYISKSGTITFAPGETEKTITVSLVDDALPESTETFKVNLTSPTNATLGTSTATGTILDNDPQPNVPPVVSIENATATEGPNAQIKFTLTLDKAASQDVVVRYSTIDGSATAANDFVGVSNGTVTIAAGQTQATITVNLKDDSVVENTESFTLRLNSATNATIGTANATGTILDNDSSGPHLVAVYDTTTYKLGDPSGYGLSDPSGLAYVPGLNLIFIADSEHDESPFNSTTNLFAVRPDGTHVASYSLTSFTKEPTGLAYNPMNGYLYITDDDQDKVFWVDPSNPSVKIGEFSVKSLGIADAEDPKFDPVTGNMYMLDGLSSKSPDRTLFELTPTGQLVRKIILPPEISDAEALAYDSAHDVFYIASGATRGSIFQLNSDGQLLGTIDFLNGSAYRNPITGGKPHIKGLELAPSSDPNDGNKLSLYAVDYGADQVSDGRLFEIDLGAGWFTA